MMLLEKVYKVEHSGRVHVLGLGVSSTNVFRMQRHLTKFVQFCSSRKMNVENLKKLVEDEGRKMLEIGF